MSRQDIRAYLLAADPWLMQPYYSIFRDGVFIGRDSEHCNVILSNDYISRKHCAIRMTEDGSMILEDMNSSNGVYVNGIRVTRQCLKEQDVISCGRPDPPHFIFSSTRAPDERIYRLEERSNYEIGRNITCQIPLAFDPTVSSTHARLRKKESALVLEDLGSTNGTFLNGAPIHSATIMPNDVVSIGSTELCFETSPSGIAVRIREKRNQACVVSENINCERQGKKILRNINLIVEPGDFIGVLGPSGAGKSTLLNALNGFVPATSGKVWLNNVSLYDSYDMFRNTIGYVPQDDIIHKELTVENSLMYTARMRLPGDSSTEQLNQHVTSVIDTLGLNHVRKNFVTQLSGGQRKRVSIGCELLTRPSLIYLDEPTSGLDPSTEEKLMRHFRLMASQGQTVIMTTHILYNLGLLDKVILLARGRLVYYGPVDEVCSYFSSQEREVTRPIEIFDLLEPETPDPEAREKAAQYYEEKYRNSSLYKKYTQVNKDTTVLQLRSPETAQKHTPQRRLSFSSLKRSFLSVFNLRQFFILMQRSFDLKFSFPLRLIVPLLAPVLLAFLTATISVGSQVELDAEREDFISSKTQALTGLETTGLMTGDDFISMRFEGFNNLAIPLTIPLIIVMTAVFLGTLSACLEISSERNIYKRERAVNLSIPMYLASKLPVLFLLAAIECFIFVFLSLIFIRAPQVNGLNIFLIALGITWVSCLIGLFISSLDPTSGKNSVLLAVLVVLPQLVFSGGMAPGFWRDMSRSTQWIASLFPARWGFEMMINAFYQQPEWARDLITGTGDGYMGFEFGAEVYQTNTIAFILLGLFYFILTWFVLKRNDQL